MFTRSIRSCARCPAVMRNIAKHAEIDRRQTDSDLVGIKANSRCNRND